MERNNLEEERNQDQDPAPCNLGQMSGAPVPNWKCSKLNLDCFVPAKRLTLAETEEINQNLENNGRNRSPPEKKAKLSLPGPTVMTQSATPRVLPSPSSPVEIAPGCGIMQLPEEVFHHLIGFVAFDDIKAARLVNKHWRQVATTPFRRSSKEIRLDHQVFDCLTKMDDGQFPVYRFEVKLYEDPEQMKICYPYFSGVCAWLKELTLKMDMDLSVYDKSQIRMDTEMFPRDCTYKDLTHLNLRLFEKSPNTRKPEFWKAFTDFVQSILRNSPNLREVSVNYSNNRGGKVPICRVIEDLFPNSNFVGTSKLSCIDLQTVPLEKIDLAKWSSLNLKLRKLGINVSHSSDLTDLLTKFLDTQAGTLKQLTLNLNRCDHKATLTFTFPSMKILEELGFTGWNWNTVINFPGIDYARLFPSLKKLDLRNSGIDWRDFLGSNLLEPTNTVEELIFPWTHLDPTPVVTASRLFPGLRKLEIPLNSSVIMDAVCANLPSLEVLSLIIGRGFNSVDKYDYLITGMEFWDCETFQDVMSEMWIKKLKTAEGRSLARLQKLKTLKLSNRSSRLICFSRLSFHVFQQMRSLKCLDLNGTADKQTRRSRFYNYNEEKKEKQFLAELREKFVVL